MPLIRNGNKDSPPELREDVFQIAVVGERKCGKTSFIRAFYNHHYPGNIYSDNGVRVYPCDYILENRLRRLAILEIPGDPDFFEQQRTPHYENADCIIFMYALDDPLSLQMLTEKWIPEVSGIINTCEIHVVVVGTKNDLRDNQQVVESLGLPYFQGLSDCKKCSANNLEEVNDIINAIIQALIDE